MLVLLAEGTYLTYVSHDSAVELRANCWNTLWAQVSCCPSQISSVCWPGTAHSCDLTVADWIFSWTEGVLAHFHCSFLVQTCSFCPLTYADQSPQGGQEPTHYSGFSMVTHFPVGTRTCT